VLASKQRSNLVALLLWRGVATALLLLITISLYWRITDVQQQGYLLDLMLLWLASFAIQGLLCSYVSRAISAQLLYQLFSDLLMIGILIFITGGFHSPFVLLLGLIIVVAGTQARVLLVLTIAVIACAVYLSAVYMFAWLQLEPLPDEATLKLLLQTSAFFLVGGVMAMIARRHALLMSESHRALQEHHDLKNIHSDLMASMQEGVLVLDVDLKVVDCNPAFLGVLNRDDVLGMELSLVADVPEGLLISLASKQREALRIEWQHHDATYLLTVGYFSQTYGHAYCWLTLVDVTMLRELQKKMTEQERLASLGRLAAMLAHEFRNPMQTIAQATEIMPRLPVNKQFKVQNIVGEEVERLNRLVADMLDYSRPLDAHVITLDVHAAVAETLQQEPFFKHRIESNIKLDEIAVDEHHWHRVLKNLLHHAIASSPEFGSVTVIVREEDACWCLYVQDHGEKLSEAMRLQMFEPFGAHRGGTGLGLATVWQTCEANDWHLAVESDDKMTCVCVKARIADGVEYG